MAIVPDPEQPAWRILTAADGTPLGHFEDEGERNGRPTADFLAPAGGVEPDIAAAAVVAQMRGWRVASDVAFGHRLLAAGARLRRHAHVMSRDLVHDPPPADWLDARPPAGYRLTRVDRPASDLAPACRAAYPPDHPDFGGMPEPARPERELDDLVSGRMLGPLLPCSALVMRDDGSVAGALLVTARPGEPPFAGPWVSQLFRHPGATGTGGPLLRRTLAVATRDGLPAVSLAVTHANPARARYAELGFADVQEAFSVDIPGHPDRPPAAEAGALPRPAAESSRARGRSAGDASPAGG